MPSERIPKRISSAILNSFSAGVVPRIGLEQVAVGRKREVQVLLEDLETIADGGGAFRFLIGRYGSGKTFLLQLMRNYAMERDFVVADADLSPARRLAGSKGQGVATYRELMRNMATKTRPDGEALAAILERWISRIQTSVRRDTELSPDDPAFDNEVEARIFEVVGELEGMVHGFDFGSVIAAYWNGHRMRDDSLKAAALRWLRGEYTTKTEARHDLNVRVIIDDDSWYDYLKLFGALVADIGYRGFLVFIDEAVNLYKITHTRARTSNYEKLLTMFNDTMQGKVAHLGILVGGTVKFLENTRRGLYSYEALRSRLAESRFVQEGILTSASPLIRLQTLTHDEIFVLLTRLMHVHASHHRYQCGLNEEDLARFMEAILGRLGAGKLLTPREVVRDFLTILDILRENPEQTLNAILESGGFRSVGSDRKDALTEGGEFAEFEL